MPNRKIAELESLVSASLADDDLFFVNDISETTSPRGEVKHITIADLLVGLEALAGISASNVHNDSSVLGNTVRDALNNLFSSSGVLNDSTVAGVTLTDALNGLASGSGIYNASNIPGDTVKDALDFISASVAGDPNGVVKETITFDNSFNPGDVIRRTPSGFELSDATFPTGSEVLGIIESADATTFTIVYSGKIFLPSHGFDNGEILFLDADNPGGMSIHDSASLGEISKPVGTVLDSGSVIVQVYRGREVTVTGEVLSLVLSSASLVDNDSFVEGSGGEVDTALNTFIDRTPAKTIYVDYGVTGEESGSRYRPYSDINTAFSNAVDGDKIVIAPGQYTQSIVVPVGQYYVDAPGIKHSGSITLNGSIIGRFGKVEYGYNTATIYAGLDDKENGDNLLQVYNHVVPNASSLDIENRFVVALKPGTYYISQSAITSRDYTDIVGDGYVKPTLSRVTAGTLPETYYTHVRIVTTGKSNPCLIIPDHADFRTQGVTWERYARGGTHPVIDVGVNSSSLQLSDIYITGSGDGAGRVMLMDTGHASMDNIVSGRQVLLDDARGNIKNLFVRPYHGSRISGNVHGQMWCPNNQTVTIAGAVENMFGINSNNNGLNFELDGGVVENVFSENHVMIAQIPTGSVSSHNNVIKNIGCRWLGVGASKLQFTILGGRIDNLGQNSDVTVTSDFKMSDVIMNAGLGTRLLIEEGAEFRNCQIEYGENAGVGLNEVGDITPQHANKGTWYNCHAETTIGSTWAFMVGNNAKIYGGSFVTNDSAAYSIAAQTFTPLNYTKSSANNTVEIEFDHQHGLTNAEAINVELIDFSNNGNDLSGDSYDGVYPAAQVDYDTSGSYRIVVDVTPSILSEDVAYENSGSWSGIYQERVKFHVTASIINVVTGSGDGIDNAGIDPDIYVLSV